MKHNLSLVALIAAVACNEKYPFEVPGPERPAGNLRALPDTIPASRLADLDDTFHLSSSGNSEILFAWLEIAIRNRYQPAFAALERFLTSQGRRKFVRPLYAELAKSDWGRATAMNIYRRARPTYHSVTSTSVDQILNWPAAAPPASR